MKSIAKELIEGCAKHVQENQKVPCCINGGLCNENFCKYIYFQRLSEMFLNRYIKEVKKEVNDYNKRRTER